MKKTKVWVVFQGDEFEYPKWVFDDETKANYVARGRGSYGSNASVREMDAIIDEDWNVVYLIESIEYILNQSPTTEEEAKSKALAKLSDYEKGLLGLNG